MFKKLAAAIAFSPRMEAILHEAGRLCQLFEAELILIHVGEENEEKKNHLSNSLRQANMDPALVPVFWEEGDPAKKIKSVCKKQKVDLLIAGALIKENIFQYYMGSVARRILRKATCSVLVLTEPTAKPALFKRIVVHAGEENDALKTITAGCFIGQKDQANHFDILKEIKMYGLTMALAGEDPEHEYSETRRNIVQENIDDVKKIVEQCPCGDLKINIKILAGKSGFEIAKFTRNHHADLLILEAPKRELNFLDRMFPNDLEYILADLPSNLLLLQAE